MRKIHPVARRYSLEAPSDDRQEWLRVPLEERLRAVWEMALFWAALVRKEAEARGQKVEICTERVLPVARRRPLEPPRG
ncbi:hypothetical protein [Thermus sp.]|uniref:hypothetical protein n=1 Tax=Thermus sp. TaxID=275 RepID=UPI0025E795DA|nr:hypothetical protein [Thermus sp.]MCS6868617.1 hypothetical protein [Thermus sp.]